MRDLQEYTAVPINVPSPLAGEGITAGRSKRGWVRGWPPDITLRRRPLTRRRFASAPSPARGEGKRGTAYIRGGRGMRRLQDFIAGPIIAVPINAPSPLAGEGSSAGQRNLDWVRGWLPDIALRKQPLTRARSANAPSPARGEGKTAATSPSCFARRPLPARGERQRYYGNI
jgi:hypothetical protein